MKKFVLVLIVCLLLPCISHAQDNDLRKPLNKGEQIIGIVQAIVEVDYSNTTPKGLERRASQAAYTALLAAAGKEFKGNIDIRDITWSKGKKLPGFMYEYSTTGKVILLGSVNQSNIATGVEGALARAAQETVKNVPQRSKIAIVYITAQDRSTTEYVAGELEYIWVNAGYTIIDRSQLERIRQEQNFQMSGEVDDNTAVSIGKIIGANIIVTGRVDGEGNLRRLRLRALDTQTAQVVGVSSERL